MSSALLCNKLSQRCCSKSFVLGFHASFDEGSFASKSRYNPVCQYNSSKPDKYRIDFFVLVNAVDGLNFIYHLDAYQGKNMNNCNIKEEAWHLSTTQKTVVNAILQSRIENDPDGMRELYMDNHYEAALLADLLHEKYKVLTCGRLRTGRKG